MDESEFDRTAREVLQLLDQQVATIYGRDFKEFTSDEVEAYQNRKRRILQLRATLAKSLGK